MPPETDIHTFLKTWEPEEPSPFLATRIVANATALPQRQAWHRRILSVFTQSFTDWQYGLAYKSAALAFCLMLGLFTAQELPQGISNTGDDDVVVRDMWENL